MKVKFFITLRVLPALFLLVMAIPMQAQWSVGVNMGYTHNSLTTSSGYFYDRVYHPQDGFTVGVPVKYAFNDWFALGGEALFIQKGYDVRRSGFYEPLHQEVSNNYLSVPLYANFSFGGKRLRGFMNVGGYMGYWLSSYTKGTTIHQFNSPDNDTNIYYDIEDVNLIHHFDEKVPFDSRRDNRFEAGGMVGAGISYMLTDKIQLAAECRYYHSLTDLQKDYMLFRVPRYNNTFAITAGVSYLLGK